MSVLNRIIHHLPWVMAQRWDHLLFTHWQVPADVLRPYVPPELELDTFEGQAWISVVPMKMADIHFRGLVLPIKSIFAQVNVRTYVTVDGKPGIYFFTIDAPRPTAVYTARWWFHLNYCMGDTELVIGENEKEFQLTDTRTHKGLPPGRLKVKYKPVSEPYTPQEGTLDHWLTDRLCMYTASAAGKVFRCDIDHILWNLQRAEAVIEHNSVLPPHIPLPIDPMEPHLMHYARTIDVMAWVPKRVR